MIQRDIVTGVGRLWGMEIDAVTRDDAEQAGPGGREAGCACSCVCSEANRVAPTELGTEDLLKLILQVDLARRGLDGYLTALLGRLGDLEGEDAVADVCRQFGLGRYRARKQAKTVEVLKALPTTLDAVQDGWIPMDHARLMGESHQRVPLGDDQEFELIALAITQDFDQFRKTVDRHENQRRGDDGTSRLEQQRKRRRASVFDGDDDMIIVHAELDRLSGERVRTALDDLHDRMFRDDFKAGNDRTHEQRNADALVALITQTPATTTTGDAASGGDIASGGDVAAQTTTLLVTVDYDALTGQLKNAGLIDGTPIGIDDLRRIACDAGVIPAIFGADGVPLYLGRKQRSASQAQRLALYARDKHCIGCGLRASACEAHHILWWEHGGHTDITNLVLLCPTCHTKVHKNGYTVTTEPGGQHKLKPPATGLRSTRDQALTISVGNTNSNPQPQGPRTSILTPQ